MWLELPLPFSILAAKSDLARPEDMYTFVPASHKVSVVMVKSLSFRAFVFVKTCY